MTLDRSFEDDITDTAPEAPSAASSTTTLNDVIVVRTLPGGKITTLYNLSLYCYISDLKSKIYEMEGYSVSDQSLFYNGIQLGDDSKTLEYYGIAYGSNLTLMLTNRRLRHRNT